MTDTVPTTSRRTLLKSLSTAPFVAAAGVAPAWAQSSAAQAGLISPNVCQLAKQATEGPYYIDPNLVRADITEGKAGVPLEMLMQVVDEMCTPIEGARVDLWHCDAEGNYSGYNSQGSDRTLDTEGETFLRGTQFTDAGGLVRFATIYPGWYRGRTTHIHYKVFLDEITVLTSQLYFPDALSEYLFQNISPYADRRTTRDTLNSNDGIAARSGDGAYAAVREQSDKYVASLVVGVSPSTLSQSSLQSFGNGTQPPNAPQSAIGLVPKRT